jgi:hypothetical protein
MVHGRFLNFGKQRVGLLLAFRRVLDFATIRCPCQSSASDPSAWQPHIGKRPKKRRELQAKRAKNPSDTLRIVIVRDMWLTGFDAPCMHTMYVDKPMKGHGLMQAIARVNRVFRVKPAGLVVDYIGVAQNLKSALRRQYRDCSDIRRLSVIGRRGGLQVVAGRLGPPGVPSPF